MVTSQEELYYRRYLNDVVSGGAQAIPIPFSPILTFSDTFTRADGDIGNNWLSQMRNNGGTTSDNFPVANISSNKLSCLI